VARATVILALLAAGGFLEAQLIRGIYLLNGARIRERADRVENKRQLCRE